MISRNRSLFWEIDGWPEKAKHEEGNITKSLLVINENNVLGAQILEVSRLGVWMVLRIERDVWSMAKWLRQAPNEYPLPAWHRTWMDVQSNNTTGSQQVSGSFYVKQITAWLNVFQSCSRLCRGSRIPREFVQNKRRRRFRTWVNTFRTGTAVSYVRKLHRRPVGLVACIACTTLEGLSFEFQFDLYTGCVIWS